MISTVEVEQTKEQELQVYHLENGRILVQFGSVLLGGVTAEKARSIMEKMLNGMDAKSFVTEARALSIRKLVVLELDDISSISTTIKGDQSVVLAYRKPAAGSVESTRLEFKDDDEKQRFLARIRYLTGQQFTEEEKSNTRRASVRLPLIYLVEFLFFGSLLAYFVYYLETATEYSFRIPAWLYFVVEFLLMVGYKTVFAIFGAIAVILLIWVIRRWVVPSRQLVLERCTSEA